MIDWWALRWMSASGFVELARACGLPLDAADLNHLHATGLVPAAQGDSEGDHRYSLAHLLPLWAYGQLVAVWRHPWGDGGRRSPDAAELGAFTERFRPFREWIEGAPAEEDWWEQQAVEMRRRHPLGRARHMTLLLDPSVLDSVGGEARLFLELDRFFAAWSALREQRRAEGDAAPSARELQRRPELRASSGPYPPVQRPLAADDDEPEPTSPRRVGLDEEVLRTGQFPAIPQTGSGAAEVLSPGEAAREHARRAAEETSALIPLAVAAKRSNTTERLNAFAQRERALFEAEQWAALAEHYRASLDLFDDDLEVGRLLKKLALVHLDRLDRVEEGTDFYLRALERLPTDKAGLKTVDHLLATQGRWEELAGIWQRTATQSHGAQSSAAWLRVASILLTRLRNMPEAIRALRFALEADATNTEARDALSNLASLSPEERSGNLALEGTRGEWTRLAAIAERWARRLENDDEAANWYERAAELYLSGRDGTDAAFACLEAALQRDAERISALARLEALARHQDRWESFERVMNRFIDRESAQGNELRLSLMAEILRERLKHGGVPERLYSGLLERLPPATRVRDAAKPAAGASGHHAELARQLIREAFPTPATPSASASAALGNGGPGAGMDESPEAPAHPKATAGPHPSSSASNEAEPAGGASTSPKTPGRT
jgi:tetratricopeptide (TPR) repeat protein